MPDNDQETLITMITSIVRGGTTPQDAGKQLARMIDAKAVHDALAEYETRTGRIRTLREPATLERKGLLDWYPGPSSEDRFWPILRRFLDSRGWSARDLQSLDDASTRVVSLLQPPGLGKIDTRGLVLGYVQSGKTANFTAVIAKAADVGYKFFLILSGITNSLRAQTQLRLERELVNLNSEDWFKLTFIDQDFRLGAGGNPDALLTGQQTLKVLGVVKKNATVLRRLRRWLASANKEVLNNCPILIIDDEADQATVNASGSLERRTAINQLLLDILGVLPKVAYVGYTATPFANVFIDPSVPQDLYPRDFIVDLPLPPAYFGPERLFGREPLTQDEPESTFDGLDMIRRVADDEVLALRPPGLQARASFEPMLTPSLEQALRYFWLATAARTARGQAAEHSSMLIHTTLYTAVHARFQPLIERYCTELLRQLRRGEEKLFGELKALWTSEQARVPAAEVGETPTDFEILRPHLLPVLERTRVIVENSQSSQRLEYGEESKVQIVVGGNTLARGLTLEGLVVSYFVRATDAYDTLLQMGRWFGYRRGYADLPRIWMTNELKAYFFDLATVEREIRNDAKRYELEGLTPLDFAIRIRTHPALSITAKLKMQSAIECDVSYSNRRVQTILFRHRDLQWLRDNLQAAEALLAAARHEGLQPEFRGRGRIIFREVPAALILAFLTAYHFHENSVELRSDLMRAYIQAQNGLRELRTWNVVVMGRDSDSNQDLLTLGPDLQVHMLERSRLLTGTATADYASVGVITTLSDTVADLNISPQTLRGKTQAELQAMRPKRIGLLLLYPVWKDSQPRGRENTPRNGVRAPLEAVENIIGVALVFPEAEKLTPQRYMTVDLSRLPREEAEWIDEEAEEAS